MTTQIGIRYLKMLLVVLVAIWGALGYDNLINAPAGYARVAHVLNMEATRDPDSWLAITSEPLVWIAWSVIPLGKLLTGFLCGIGAWKMWKARNATGDQFNRSKGFAILGCGASIVMLYGGFMVAADTYFKLWQSEVDPIAIPLAFRYFVCIMLIMMFVHMEDRDDTA